MRTKAYISSLSIIFSLTAALIFSACSDDDDPGGDAGTGAETVVRIGTTGALADLDPAAAADATTSEVLRNLNYTLYVFNPKTLDYDPGLASGDPEIGAQGTEWTITLRSGLKFADGTPLDANAVKYSVDRSQALKKAGSGQLEEIESVEVVDDLKVKFTLSGAAGLFQTVLGDVNLSPVNKSVYPTDKVIASPFGEGADEPDWGDENIDQTKLDPTKLLGLGPYTLSAIEVDEANGTYKQLTMQMNPDFRDVDGAAPKSDVIILKFYADEAALAAALKAGEIDIASNTLSAASLQEFADDTASYGLIESGGLQVETLLFNHRIAPFDDKAIRQAVAAAIDRKPLGDSVFPLTGRPVYSPIPEGMWSHKAVFKDEYGASPDLDQIKADLATAGFDADNKLAFGISYAEAFELDATAAQVKTILEATGVITVTLNSEGTTEKYFGILIGTDDDDKKNHTLQAFVVGWASEVADPDDFLFQLYHSTQDLAGVSYANSAFDTLILDARNETDFVTRRGKYEDAQTIFAQDAVSVPMIQRTSIVVVRTGFTVDAPGVASALAYETAAAL